MKDQIMEAVERLRPLINRDGGDIQFVDYDEDEKVVYIEMLGACRGCPASYITLKSGVEHALREEFPGSVETVEQIYAD